MDSIWIFKSLEIPIFATGLLGILLLVFFAAAQNSPRVAQSMNRYYVPLAILSLVLAFVVIWYLLTGWVTTVLFNQFPILYSDLYRGLVILLVAVALAIGLFWFINVFSKRGNVSTITPMPEIQKRTGDDDVRVLIKTMNSLIKEMKRDRKAKRGG